MNTILQQELKKILNGRFSQSESTRLNYSRGEDTYDPILSKAVVFPETNEEVSKILKLCNEHKVPVVPFGTGTSCLLYTSPSPRDKRQSRMPSSA